MTRVHSDSSTPSQTGAHATFFPLSDLSNCSRNCSRASAAFAGAVIVHPVAAASAARPIPAMALARRLLVVIISILPLLQAVRLRPACQNESLIPLFGRLFVSRVQ